MTLKINGPSRGGELGSSSSATGSSQFAEALRARSAPEQGAVREALRDAGRPRDAIENLMRLPAAPADARPISCGASDTAARLPGLLIRLDERPPAAKPIILRSAKS
ncbi:hypothetical protein ABEG18_20075 [Alsobacter sp. KACC 23698]|uniref:Uncharacterized protein n=1 Tax=Alsobacter sp. KACC 23698 TaxID=3149229 RepID=A0AAU7JD44_9HYPH